MFSELVVRRSRFFFRERKKNEKCHTVKNHRSSLFVLLSATTSLAFARAKKTQSQNNRFSIGTRHALSSS